MKKAKFFIFNFVEGGHNSVWAYALEDAVSTYYKMSGKRFTIDESTLRELSAGEVDDYWDTYKNPDRGQWGKLSPKGE